MVHFLSSTSLDQTESTRKEELIELLSRRAHANVRPNRSRSEREKLAIVASMREVLCATPSA